MSAPWFWVTDYARCWSPNQRSPLMSLPSHLETTPSLPLPQHRQLLSPCFHGQLSCDHENSQGLSKNVFEQHLVSGRPALSRFCWFGLSCGACPAVAQNRLGI